MKRAIGIIRVSEVGGRDGDRFHSPAIQREHIERDCERWGLELIDVVEEMDVSGGKPLRQRLALKEALRWVEEGMADAIVFAYRDRVDRSIEHGSELVRRMDAKGALLIADGQRITHSTHDGWRKATFESFLNEDQRRAIAAKMVDVHERAVAQGKAPFNLPPGYRKRDDGTSELDPETAPLIRRAFAMRAEGVSTTRIHAWLRDSGIDVSLNTVTRLLKNRFYLGELHYRRWSNRTAHEPLVDADLFERARAHVGSSRGRYAKSEHLLARQGILRCASCDSKLSASGRGTQRVGGAYYRCYNQSCPARPTINALTVEALVSERARELCHELIGKASGAEAATAAKTALDESEAHLSRLRRRLAAAGDEDEAEAVEMVRVAREARDAAQTAYDEALALGAVVKVDADYVFDHGELQDQRDLIVAVIKTVTVAKGKGLDRVTIEGKTL